MRTRSCPRSAPIPESSRPSRCSSRRRPVSPPPHMARTQTTGATQVLGLASGYAAAFPGELRLLTGSLNGVLVAQQTASNLHVAPGDTVTIARPGFKPAQVTVGGVVDLPQADSLFQKVGAPPGAQLSAPPDNVILLPQSEFARVQAPIIATRPELIRIQVHVILSHHLASSPSAAFDNIAAKAHNLESRLTGQGLVGDNLGVALDTARKDALYAQILFLFLGVPGAILAGLVTALIASAGADRRRRDAALLRTRGASTRTLVRIAMAETLFAGILGVIVGLGAALLIGSSSFGTASFGAGSVSAILWAVGAALSAWPSPPFPSRCPRCGMPAHSRWPASVVKWAEPTAVPCGLATGLISSRWPSPGSCTGRHHRAATSSCSRRRAWPRCRSTGTPSSRPCWAGSAWVCSPTESPTCSSPGDGSRSPGRFDRSPESSLRLCPRPWVASVGSLHAPSHWWPSPLPLRDPRRSSTPPTRPRPRSTRASRTELT